jgi:hypothetical protein
MDFTAVKFLERSTRWSSKTATPCFAARPWANDYEVTEMRTGAVGFCNRPSSMADPFNCS